ncbi:MAG: decaprenyl-phosphate phosphoribosyltransferase [Chloroflexi bacterium]|nr:MAG: decaprenyl-phosphate phosphoribosyltransferase [Chloroflexota bacterium]
MVRWLTGLIRTMRPYQWTKNVLFILPPIIFDGKLFDFEALLRVIGAIVLFSLMAGAVYIINDLVDIERDRVHPQKRYRPLPSGQLSVQIAIIAAVILPIVAVVLAWGIRWSLAVVLIGYFILQLLYSFVLKNIVILDLMGVTAGFVLRLVAGVVAVPVENFSPWLYACGGLLALFLIVGKRRQDLVQLGDMAVKTRTIYQYYNLALLDEMLRMVTTSTFIAYILYTIEAPTIKVANTNAALATVPFVLYGLFRYLYLIHVKGEGGAPDEVLLHDRWIQVTVALWGGSFVLLLYVLPG